jgi:hypothetical protein
MKAESVKQDTVGSAVSVLYKQRPLSSQAGGRSIEINAFFVLTIFGETVELTRTACFKHFRHNPNKRIKYTPFMHHAMKTYGDWRHSSTHC